MEIQDDREQREKRTHSNIVVGIDTFLSGWGRAKEGRSMAGWACLPEHVETVRDWVRNRSDMKRVRVVKSTPARPYKPTSCAHFHVYVVTEGHPALAGLAQ